MTAINEQIIYLAGPYHGYCGKAEYDHQAKQFHGEVTGTRDTVTFQAKKQEELRAAFQESVDDYLAFCKERNEEPEKPFSGKFMARIPPALHRTLSTMAELSGKSLNQLVGECLESFAAAAPGRRTPPQSGRQAPADTYGRKKVAKRAATTHSKPPGRKRSA